MTPVTAIAAVRAILAPYVFHPNNEADLQVQVAAALGSCSHVRIRREVVSGQGRYDILVEVLEVDPKMTSAEEPRGIHLVLELKVTGTAESAERQAQRYARDAHVDAVAVVTSSQRLARRLLSPGALNELGGKPFAVIALRSV